MVYRGKPSAGCENCRKAKKRCGLERPACSYCVRLKKQCSGYRDVSTLQVQDESAAVIERARRRAGVSTATASSSRAPVRDPTPPRSESSHESNNETVDEVMRDYEGTLDFGTSAPTINIDEALSQIGSIMTLRPTPDDVSIGYFFTNFTNRGHWEFLKPFVLSPKDNPTIYHAIRACGMAALNNVNPVPQGKEWARSLYGDALIKLNNDLRDPVRSTTNEALMACAMLSYFENLTCDSRQSIESWKAHMNGAAQLLRLRGKSQFKTPIGRALFRETRAQILTLCIWDDLKPPDYFVKWQPDLHKATELKDFTAPSDNLAQICFDFAILRAQIRLREIAWESAVELAATIEVRMIEWASDTLQGHPRYKYVEVEVPDSPNVWNGMVQTYDMDTTPAIAVWQTYRSIRIMLTRTQEMLVRRCQMEASERSHQIQYFKSIRRQMAEEICATVPTALGHAAPASPAKSTLLGAYGQIWPLFFAGTVTLERMAVTGGKEPTATNTSAVSAQVAWILSQMDHISHSVGIRWADGVAATLRGDFRLHYDLLDGGELDYMGPEEEKDTSLWAYLKRQRERKNVPGWLEHVEQSGRGPRMLVEPENPITNSLKQTHAKWLGRYETEGHPLADADRLYDGEIACRCATGGRCFIHELYETDPKLYWNARLAEVMPSTPGAAEGAQVQGDA